MSRFAGKVAIVTGSSSGIGRATALLIAKESGKVTITGRNEARLDETKQLIIGNGVDGSNVNVIVADITTDKGQNDIIQSTIDKFGKLDILINNAGTSIPDANGLLGLEQGVDTYQKTFEINFQVVIEMTQKCRKYLKESHGDIVNVSSISGGAHVWPISPYYANSKAALDSYTRSAAIELVKDNIRVNGVAPGFVQTGLASARGLSSEQSDNFYNYVGSQFTCIPRGYCGQPDHIAKSIAFLADRKMSDYMIGQTIVVDGGSSVLSGSHAVLMKNS